MDPDHRYPPLPPLSTGIAGRCPRCGRGALFEGFLGPRKQCSACGLDYGIFDPGDGPAVFIILIAGFVVCGLALIVEVTFQPAYWVHALLWIPLVLILTLGLLRPLKGVMIAQQYRHQAAEGRLADAE